MRMLHSIFAAFQRGALLAPLALLLVLAACDSVEERIAKHYERGQSLVEEGQLEKAILEFSNALQLDDKHALSHFAIGKIHETRGELQAAFGRYRKVAELTPDHAEARLKLARFYVLGNDLKTGKAELDAAMKLAPNVADAHVLAATIALREGDAPATRTALDKAYALTPSNAEAAMVEVSYLRQTEGYAAAIARADEAIKEHPKTLGLYLLTMQMLEEIGDETAIGSHLGKMIEAFPEEPQFRRSRAQWALRNDDMKTAETELRAIVSALPDNREAVLTLIRFLRQQQGDAAARDELAKQIELSGDPFPLELMLAQFDVETGQTEVAIAYLRDLIGRAGENANQARVVLARLLLGQNSNDEAYALVDEILAEDSKNVDALVLQIARQVDTGKLDEALQAVRTGLNEAPDDIRLLLLAGRAQELAGNLDLASDRFAKAVRVSKYNPGNVERYVQFLTRSNRTPAAETVLAEATERHPDNARLYDMLASLRLQQDDWVGAETALQRLDELDAPRARQLRAAMMIGQERFDEGIALLQDLPEDQAQRTATIGALVQTYVRDGKVDEAKAFLEDLLAQNPKNLQALGIRGNLYAAERDFDAARADYQAILEIDPKNGGAHSALARLHQIEGNIDGAEQTLRTGLEASPGNALLLLRLAQLVEGRGDFEQAIDIYDELYQAFPDSMLIANNLSSLLSDHRKSIPEQLNRAYAIAGRLRNAELPQYKDTYGWTRYLKGEYEEALRFIEPALEELPGNPWVHYHIGMVHAALKQPAKARTHLEEALKLAGENNFPPTLTIRNTLDGLGQ